MSKPWGNIGAWAAEAERAEEEERTAAASKPEENNFPSLKESIAAKPKKKKMTLGEFNSSVAAAAPGSYGSLTHDERLRLPTGPKERSLDDDDRRNFGGRLGGGFSSYGDRDGPSRSDGGGRRGGFDDDRRGPPPSRVSDFEPSRADEADNWAATKKPMASFNNTLSRPGGGNARYESLGGGGSRSDDVDNWAMGKRAQAPPLSASGHSRSFSGFGSGFRDSHDQGMESDRWTRGGGGFGDDGGRSERPRLVLDPPSRNVSGNTVENLNEGVKSHRANPFGAARPREEVLAEKGLDYKKVDLEIAAKKSVGVTSGDSRPSSAHSNRSESQSDGGGVKPRPRVNPFGDAKPREVLLEEKGLDWRKIDSEFDRRTDRPLSEEEKMLKDEIENLRKEMERQVSLKDGKESAGNGTYTGAVLAEKERELEVLTRDLDDKARVGQKGIDRPGSRSGRVGSFSDRPSSRSGTIDDSRSVDYNDRPLSRGSGDAWGRTGNERRGFQGARDREFSGSRDFDRSRSRDGW